MTLVQNLSLNLVQNLAFKMAKIGPEPNLTATMCRCMVGSAFVLVREDGCISATFANLLSVTTQLLPFGRLH